MQVSMAVNNEAGNHSGYIRMIDFWLDGDVGLELEAGAAIRCRVNRKKKVVRIDGKEYPFMRYGTWAGNTSWDAMGVSEETALRLVEDCRASGKWSMAMAYEHIDAAWDSGQPITFDEPVKNNG